MQTLATISRTTKKGYTSTWYFVEGIDGYYAFGGCHKPIIKKFDTLNKLRALYAKYIEYGYTTATTTKQLELAFWRVPSLLNSS